MKVKTLLNIIIIILSILYFTTFALSQLKAEENIDLSDTNGLAVSGGFGPMYAFTGIALEYYFLNYSFNHLSGGFGLGLINRYKFVFPRDAALDLRYGIGGNNRLIMDITMGFRSRPHDEYTSSYNSYTNSYESRKTRREWQCKFVPSISAGYQYIVSSGFIFQTGIGYSFWSDYNKIYYQWQLQIAAGYKIF
jgi:hypothetical protein